mgnify:CR=1 FL=1
MPFSARATVIFALAGTYLGSGWVVSIYVFDLVVIGLTGRIISDRLKTVGMGFIMDIPPYRLPHLKQENLVQSRFTMLVKVSGKDRTSVVTALSQHVCTLPTVLRRSLTWDRGMELAQHKRLTVDTEVRVYFCDPQSPWQRGTNENTNRLLRQYLPKCTDLSRYSQTNLDTISLRMNQRPRQTLGFQTPAAILEAAVATTA